MLLRGSNAVGYTAYPDNLVDDFVAKAKRHGVDIFRVFDSLNFIPNLAVGIRAVQRAGGVVEAAVCYTGDILSPDPHNKYDCMVAAEATSAGAHGLRSCGHRYTLAYYAGKVAELVALGIHFLAIKDMAGVLKPRAATLLISHLRRDHPTLPIHVHTHDTAGT